MADLRADISATGEVSEMGTTRTETLTCWHEQVVHTPGGGETHRVSELLRWMDEATVIMSGLSKDRVIDSVEIATSHHAEAKRAIKPVKDYEADNVSKKILRIIVSYIDYVNRTVWHKE